MYKHMNLYVIEGGKRRGKSMIGMFTGTGKVVVGTVVFVVGALLILSIFTGIQAALGGHPATVFYGGDTVKFVERVLAEHRQPTDLEIRRELERHPEEP